MKHILAAMVFLYCVIFSVPTKLLRRCFLFTAKARGIWKSSFFYFIPALLKQQWNKSSLRYSKSWKNCLLAHKTKISMRIFNSAPAFLFCWLLNYRFAGWNISICLRFTLLDWALTCQFTMPITWLLRSLLNKSFRDIITVNWRKNVFIGDFVTALIDIFGLKGPIYNGV